MITFETLRTMSGLKQDKMAKKLGMCRQSYAKKENYESDFKWQQVLKMKAIAEKNSGQKISLDDIK